MGARTPNAAVNPVLQQGNSAGDARFITDVLSDKYILVIGNEAILDPARFDGKEADDSRLLIRRAVQDNVMRGDPLFDVSRYSYREMVTTLLNHKGNNGEPDYFFCDPAEVSPELRTLLETRLFRVILTPTYDFYIENLMREIWGEELVVVNIADHDDVASFQERIRESRSRAYFTLPPVLIYIFGKAERSRRFVLEDNDAFDFIKWWMHDEQDDRKVLVDFIKQRHTLALGCKFDDWYFRFFWYILNDSRKYRTEDGSGHVAIPIDMDDRSDRNLLSYLSDIHVDVQQNSQAFIRKLNDALRITDLNNPFREQILASRCRGGAFLSYKNADRILASRLYFTLVDKGFKLWFDNANLELADDYGTEIVGAVQASRVMLVLLTPAVAADLEAGDTEHFYCGEWRLAHEAGVRIIAIAAEGYDLRAPYHKRFEEIAGSVSGLELTRDDFSKLENSLRKLLG